jgi:hypothetical protein
VRGVLVDKSRSHQHEVLHSGNFNVPAALFVVTHHGTRNGMFRDEL